MEKEILTKLLELQDEKYKEFSAKLSPNCDFKRIGIKVPSLRDLAKKIAKSENFKEYLEKEETYYEEIMLKGFIIGYSKMEFAEKLKYIEKFIPKIKDWAICDTFCPTLKDTNKNKEKMWEFINKYLNSQNEFDIRFAVIMMLDFYITDEYIDLVLENLNNIKHEGYYVKMAVAWTISVAYIKFKDKTLKFFNETKIDDWTFNKALQKIIESNRVTEEEKNEIRKMKRK